MSRSRKNSGRLIGQMEFWGLSGAGLFGAGLFAIYWPLSLLWAGGVIMGLVWLSMMPKSKKREG